MASTDGAALSRKRDIYSLLDSTEEDDAPDIGRQASVQAMQRTSAKTGLQRSMSDSTVRPQPQVTRSLPAEQVPPLPTRRTVSGTGISDGVRAFGNVPASPSYATGKRKRTVEVPPPPQIPRLFNGLVFYFFPNNDKHPARKMRIAKAVGHGARWEKQFNDDVTHVIADKNMDYPLLLKYLKRDALADNVVVVSEDYTAECMSYQTLLDASNPQFRVKGLQRPAGATTKPHAIDESPKLKEAGKAVAARRPETPRTYVGTISSPSSDIADDDAAHPHPSVTTDPIVASQGGMNIESNEETDAAIHQARQFKDVPLHQDDEEDAASTSRPTSSEGPDTDDEEAGERLQLLKKKKNKYHRYQDKFQCMQKHTGAKTETPNASVIAILQQMADYYDKIGDEWRLRAYRKAMATLRNHPTKVSTREEALALPQIGERLATKIEEIAITNRLRRLDNAKAEPEDQILQAFMQIYGVGFSQASKWVSAGYKTLDELWEADQKEKGRFLTDNQRVGVQHYEDFQRRIPRAEVKQHGDIVSKYLQRIDHAFEIIVGGSYRRGSDTSGDIDCIISHPDLTMAQIRHIIQDQLIPKLFAKKFVVAALATTSKDDGSKWHGASQLPSPSSEGLENSNPWRRIDFLLVPPEEMGAALIYFTGNDIFNRSLRLLAGTEGMRLNQRGLYKDVMRGKGRVKLTEGTLVEGRDEKKIFEALGVPWRPPEHRNC
jgi:DNA polymerase IV